MLDVLHCVLIDSPEALNMMKVSIAYYLNRECKASETCIELPCVKGSNQSNFYSAQHLHLMCGNNLPCMTVKVDRISIFQMLCMDLCIKGDFHFQTLNSVVII
jgi:hypothetical protein